MFWVRLLLLNNNRGYMESFDSGTIRIKLGQLGYAIIRVYDEEGEDYCETSTHITELKQWVDKANEHYLKCKQ